MTAGGAGFGAAFERDPALVLADVEAELLTVGHAATDYGVVITGNQVNAAATAALRAARADAD